MHPFNWALAIIFTFTYTDVFGVAFVGFVRASYTVDPVDENVH